MSWNQLKESQFDREPYRNCDRFGEWEAVLDRAAYSHGSRMTLRGQGKRAGIHLYVRAADTDEKYWLYVLYRSDSESYRPAMELREGDRFRVQTVQTKSDHAWVKTLDALPVPQ